MKTSDIDKLKVSTRHMMLIWKAVGVLALVAVAIYLTRQFT